MKKIKNILGCLAFIAVVLLPVNIKALQADLTSVKSSCNTPDSEGYCETTIFLRFQLSSTSEELMPLQGTLKLKDPASVSGIKDVTIKSALEGVVINAQGSTSDGYTISMVFSGAKLSAAQYTNAVQITYKHLSTMTTDCGFKFVATLKDDTLETETETETQKTTVTTNTKTGASLPYVVLGSIAVGAIALYVTTNRKSKLHNI